MIESAAYDIIKKEGYIEGEKEGRQGARNDTAKNLILLGVLSDEQIAQATEMNVAEVLRLKSELKG